MTSISVPITWAADSNRAVKQKELPIPTSLSTQIRPCMSATSRLDMLSPDPAASVRKMQSGHCLCLFDLYDDFPNGHT